MQNRGMTSPVSFRLFILVLVIALVIVSLSIANSDDRARAAVDYSWETQNLFHAFLKDVCVIDADNAWVAGDRDTILRTDDGGVTWLDKKPDTNSHIYGVSACDAVRAWAIGHNYPYPGGGIILHTIDGGDSWTTQFLDAGYEFNAVVVVDNLTVWVVGDTGAILKTCDGGESWDPQDSGVSGSLNSICAVDAETAWIAADDGMLLKTENGGDDWYPQDSGTSNDLHAVHALDAMNAWAAGENGTILKTVDAGQVWNMLDPGFSYDLNDIFAADAQTIWAVGDDESLLEGKVLKTSDGGDSWVLQHSLYYMADGVAAADTQNVWVVGGDIDILKSGDGGATWVDQCPGTTSVLPDVCAIDTHTAWIVRGAGDVLITVDGGESWASKDTGPDDPDGGLFGISALGAETAWVVGVDGLILKTEDGGDIWSHQISGTSETLFGVCAVDEHAAWAVGAGGTIIKTSDGGLHWSQQVSGTSSTIADISAVSAEVAWAICEDVNNYESLILKTTDGGENWLPVSPDMGFPYMVSSICAVDSEIAWAAGNSLVLKTVNGGEDWEETFINEGDLLDICAPDEYTAWAVGCLSNYEELAIFKTGDGGATWRRQERYIAPILYGISAADPCTAWTVGVSGLVLHTSNGGDDWPDICSISPSGGGMGTEVTISGCDFGASRESSLVVFGDTPAEEYISWSDSEIVVRVPSTAPGETVVTVTTAAGTSNQKPFSVSPLLVQSITPDHIMQHTISLDVEIQGEGFEPGIEVSLVKGAGIINAYNVNVVSDTTLTCTAGFFGVEPGAYDVVVRNPDGQEAILAGGFTVDPICGSGSGTALLMLGLTLGLLSLAGSTRLRRRRRRQ